MKRLLLHIFTSYCSLL